MMGCLSFICLLPIGDVDVVLNVRDSVLHKFEFVGNAVDIFCSFCYVVKFVIVSARIDSYS